MWEHRSLAIGIMLSSWIYILMISLIAMALSAWVKWRIAAGALILGVMFFLTGFGAAINAVLGSHIGFYIAPGALITARVRATFRIGIAGRNFRRKRLGGVVGNVRDMSRVVVEKSPRF